VERKERELQLLTFVRQMAKLRRSCAPEFKGELPEELLLRHGQWFRQAPHALHMGRAKECFANAQRQVFVGEEHLVYCEGYAASVDGIMPVLHGWVSPSTSPSTLYADTTPLAYDLTWSESGGLYFGVMFERKFVSSRIVATEMYESMFESCTGRPAVMSFPAQEWLFQPAL
jgi:hypothetical protein